jgi:hypothetical protein
MGTPIDDVPSNLPTSNNGHQRHGADLTIVVDGVQALRIDSELVTASILSLGAVGALLLFIHESFLHPSEATILVPLILAPVGQTINYMIQRRRLKQAECQKCKTSDAEAASDGLG